MSEKRRELGDDIIRALQTLHTADADDSDGEVATAYRTLARLLPHSSPRPDFSDRVITAVCRAPLPAGRQRLRTRRRPTIAGLAGTTTAVCLWTVLWATGLAQFVVTRMFLIAVQSGVLAIRSVSFMLEIWSWVDRAARVLTAVFSSVEVLGVLVVVVFLSALSLAAITRLVSSSQRESIKC
jgi:hypothetical protein